MKRITKTGAQARKEMSIREMIDRENATCPECGYYDLFNGGVCCTRREGWFKVKHKNFELFKCRKCGCEWEVEEY